MVGDQRCCVTERNISGDVTGCPAIAKLKSCSGTQRRHAGICIVAGEHLIAIYTDTTSSRNYAAEIISRLRV